jgi:two-component system nitrate/nitrite response regulator NarL
VAGVRAGSVLVVDDHGAIAQAVAASLRVEGFDPVTVAPSTAAPDVLALVAELRPEVALLDLHLGNASGEDLVGPLIALGTPVVVLTGVEAEHRLGGCLRAGATAVLSKSVAFDELVKTVHAVVAGNPAMPLRRRAELVQASLDHGDAARRRSRTFDALSPKERAVLHHLAAGRSAAEIARSEGIRISTVRTHIRGVLAKLGVGSQQAAIALAHREGFE